MIGTAENHSPGRIRNPWGTTPGSVAGVLLGVDTVREFTVVTSTGYQGSRGVKLNRLVDANIPIPQTLEGRIFFPAGSTRRNPLFDQRQQPARRGD